MSAPVLPVTPPTAMAAKPSMLGSAGKATAAFFGQPSVKSWLWFAGLPILAFIVLSPGMMVTLPPAKDCDNNSKFWFSGQTSFVAVLLHSLLFLGLLVAIFKGGDALKYARPF